MAITSSAKKALRVSKRRRVFNVRRQKKVEDVLRTVRKLISDKKKSESLKVVAEMYRAIDKAVRGKTISKNTGARKKSRLMAQIHKIK